MTTPPTAATIENQPSAPMNALVSGLTTYASPGAETMNRALGAIAAHTRPPAIPSRAAPTTMTAVARMTRRPAGASCGRSLVGGWDSAIPRDSVVDGRGRRAAGQAAASALTITAVARPC